ncbi:hypothetical protein JOQ06_029518 [Pogonophryne albipinna]|uniref:SRCR domain-containing protein n=1 Tax=Pogonophryne albipinna TaxID=1090488 RepID=A0AAD6ADE6_9TELE|nr:hypothetical protein JOQ06_029518 [Pogonophryne albipinna]
MWSQQTCESVVRLVGGESRCAGDLEVKHQGEWRPLQANALWNLKTAAVVCRELDCGSAVSVGEREESSERPVWNIRPTCVQSGSALRNCAESFSSRHIVTLTCSDSVRLGALYGEGEAPMWTKEFSVGAMSLLSWTVAQPQRETPAHSGRAVSLTCSEPVVRLVEGKSRCAGTLESEPDLRECAEASSAANIVTLTCSDSVRLVNETSPCSGRLEVKSNQSNPSWSSVCETDFDQQDAQVVCRQLGCGAPSVLQGALYGEGEAPMWTKEFQCGGHESALLDCSSASERNTCSPGTAVSLTCSEPVRLVGGESRCAGDLEVRHEGEWRAVSYNSPWTLKAAKCFSAEIWELWLCCFCGREKGVLKETCVVDQIYLCSVWICSEGVCSSRGHFLKGSPNISVSSSMYGVSGAQQQGIQVFRGSTFTISCSIQPQYPGGSFQLNFTSINSANTYYSLPAVNHSAHFLFPSAEPAHQGSYSYPEPFIIRAVVLPLILLLVTVSLYFYCKATRGRRPSRQEDIELDYLGVPAEEEGAPGAE